MSPAEIKSSTGTITYLRTGSVMRSETPSGTKVWIEGTSQGFDVSFGPEDVSGWDATSGDVLDLAGDKVAIAISNKELEDREKKEEFSIKK